MTGDHCPCIAISHNHKPGQCDEPMTPQGGICVTCRFYHSEKPDPVEENK